jgi:TPP-dependent pyruvate/acetoin dehydrogenase alpha subunit
MKYAKFVVAVATTALIALGAALTDDHVTTAEWVAIVLAGLGALGVYAVPNRSAQDK